MTGQRNRWQSSLISGMPQVEQAEKTGLFLHHLPENLCRFMEIYVGSGQHNQNGKDAKLVDITAFADL